jgi:hypothetical protein
VFRFLEAWCLSRLIASLNEEVQEVNPMPTMLKMMLNVYGTPARCSRNEISVRKLLRLIIASMFLALPGLCATPKIVSITPAEAGFGDMIVLDVDALSELGKTPVLYIDNIPMTGISSTIDGDRHIQYNLLLGVNNRDVTEAWGRVLAGVGTGSKKCLVSLGKDATSGPSPGLMPKEFTIRVTPQIIGVTPAQAGLGMTLTLQVAALASVGRTPTLYIDGTPLMGTSPVWNDGRWQVQFLLNRAREKEESRAAWQRVLQGIGSGIRRVRLDIGQDNSTGPMAGSKPVAFELQVVRQPWGWIAGGLVLALLIFFILIAAKTTILRGKGPDPTKTYAFSLGRTQMAFWFFLVIASFLSIWLVTGDLSVNATALTLIGISSGTALGAALIDADPTKVPETTGNFFKDILSDEHGYAFHRFQIFSWTLILGVVYIASVLRDVAMPTFDDTLLALIGISSGVYIGFKFPEARKIL